MKHTKFRSHLFLALAISGCIVVAGFVLGFAMEAWI